MARSASRTLSRRVQSTAGHRGDRGRSVPSVATAVSTVQTMAGWGMSIPIRCRKASFRARAHARRRGRPRSGHGRPLRRRAPIRRMQRPRRRVARGSDEGPGRPAHRARSWNLPSPASLSGPCSAPTLLPAPRQYSVSRRSAWRCGCTATSTAWASARTERSPRTRTRPAAMASPGASAPAAMATASGQVRRIGHLGVPGLAAGHGDPPGRPPEGGLHVAVGATGDDLAPC